MIQVMVIAHAIVGIFLLGAITHQAFSVARYSAVSKETIVGRFRSVSSPAFTNTIVILFAVATLAGGLLYPRYRIDVRTTLEDLQLRAANGVFEMKEHFAAVGLGLLPIYWLYWRPPFRAEDAPARKYLTWMLAGIVWWNFLVGEVLNNIKGLYP